MRSKLSLILFTLPLALSVCTAPAWSCGWYLMAPPFKEVWNLPFINMGRKYNGVDFPSPLHKWELIEAFENLKECRAAQQERYSKNLNRLNGDDYMIAAR